MGSNDFQVPVFLHREMTTLQCFDVASRITDALVQPASGLPERDWLNRQVARDLAKCLEEYSARMRIERTGVFTRDKRRAHLERRRFVGALRAGAQQLVRNPDPRLSQEQRDAGAVVLSVFAKHKVALRSQGQSETSGAVKLLLEDFASEKLTSALVVADLTPLLDLVAEAQGRFLDIVRQEEIAEAQATMQRAASDPDKADEEMVAESAAPRRLREIKDALAERFDLIFTNAAYLARGGDEQYAAVLNQCAQITTEANSLLKLRETLDQKAEAKEREKEAAKNPTDAETAPAATARATTTESTTSSVVTPSGAAPQGGLAS